MTSLFCCLVHTAVSLLVLASSGSEVGGVDGHGGLDLGLRLVHLVVEHLKEALADLARVQLVVERLLDLLVAALQ